jgi:hypothetical protein
MHCSIVTTLQVQVLLAALFFVAISTPSRSFQRAKKSGASRLPEVGVINLSMATRLMGSIATFEGA